MTTEINCGVKRKLCSQENFENDTEEDETMECSICSDNWTASGPHRLVSLKCGHLYGETCIIRWIERSSNSKARCPHCKMRAKLGDLRQVIPVNLATQDTAQVESLRKELEIVDALIAERQHHLSKSLLALTMSQRELEKINVSLQQDSLSSDSNITMEINTQARSFQHYRTEYLSAKDLCTRMMSLHQDMGSAFVTTKENGHYGISEIPLDRPDQCYFLPIHTGAIRDVKCQGDLLLTCGHDKTMKLTSIKTKQVVNTFALNAPGWSCSFNMWRDTPAPLLYCGLSNGVILVFDQKQPQLPIYRLEDRSLTGGSPVYSILPMTGNSKSMIVCGNHNKIYAWIFNDTSFETSLPSPASPSSQTASSSTVGFENKENVDTLCHVFKLDHLEDFRPYSLSLNTDNETILISLRRNGSSKHVIGKIMDDLTIKILHTFDYPYEQQWLARNALFTKLGTSIISYADSQRHSVCLRSELGEEKLFPIGERIFAIQHMENADDMNGSILAALTATKLHLYRYLLQPSIV